MFLDMAEYLVQRINNSQQFLQFTMICKYTLIINYVVDKYDQTPKIKIFRHIFFLFHPKFHRMQLSSHIIPVIAVRGSRHYENALVFE